MSCALWKMTSHTHRLKVSVAAVNREDAIQNAMRAYERMVGNPCPSFHEELRENLKQNSHRGMIEVTS